MAASEGRIAGRQRGGYFGLTVATGELGVPAGAMPCRRDRRDRGHAAEELEWTMWLGSFGPSCTRPERS